MPPPFEDFVETLSRWESEWLAVAVFSAAHGMKCVAAPTNGHALLKEAEKTW